MSALINIVVDVTLTTSWWILRRTTVGIYSGVHYLIWGNIETKDEIERKQILLEIESQKNLLLEMKDSISNITNDKDNKDDFNADYYDTFKESPPSYTDSIQNDKMDDMVIVDEKTTIPHNTPIKRNGYQIIGTL